MIGGATQALTATVANDASNAGVTWSVTGGGSFSAVTTASGIATTFTSANPVASTSAVVTATSVKDPTKSASLTITLTPIAVSFSTMTSGITLDSGQTLALAAAVANDSSASGATFKVTGAGTLNPATATGNTPSTTLTATGTVASTVTVTATSIKDPSRSVTTATMTVNPAPAIITPSGALAPGTTNAVYAGATIAASGGTGAKAFSINSGTLPSGLTINGSTGVISGTPTGTAGTSTFTVKVTDSATTPVSVSSGSYSIIISAAPLLWVSPATATNTYTVGTAITPISLTTSGGTGAIAYSLHTGTLPAGLSIAGNILSGTPTAPTVVAGNVVNFLATDSATTPVTAVSANLTLIVNPVTLVITSASLPTGTVNAPYSYQLTSTGGVGTITWSLSAGSLTGTGLALSGSGLLSGTPTASQSSLSLTFQAKDSATNQQQTVTKVLPLTVANALTVTSNSTLANATVNVAYSQTLAAAGGSGSGYTWTVTSGATGTNSLATLNLSLSSAGVLTGTPATTGTANFTAQVKDSANHTATATFTVTAYAALSLPAPNPTSLGTAVVNQSYTGSITATGGIPGYNWTINGAALGGSPISLGNGLSASSNGALLSITGTPTTTSTVSFTAKITDSASTTAGPLTYTIAVSATSTVSGNISLLNNCGGAAVPSITLSINTSPVQTTTTTNGAYSFANIPNGTYTITPSISGASSVFYPATQSVTISGTPVTAPLINAALGYTVSGTVAYAGSKTGQIYLSLNSTTCGGGGSQGTSISSAGAYTIRGVPPGAYTLQAFMDNLGYGLTNTSNPVGNISVTVSTANFTSANVTLADPATATLSQGPTLKGVSAFSNGAAAGFRGIKDSNGVEAATSYTLQWSTTSTFTTIAGSQTFPAVGNHSNVWLLNSAKNPSLTNGSVYYFRAYGSSAGTAISPYSSTVGPVTIGAPDGCRHSLWFG